MGWNGTRDEMVHGTDYGMELMRAPIPIPVRVLVEMTTLKAIHAAGGHDNIARVLDVFEDSTFYFFVLELVSVVVVGSSSSLFFRSVCLSQRVLPPSADFGAFDWPILLEVMACFKSVVHESPRPTSLAG